MSLLALTLPEARAIARELTEALRASPHHADAECLRDFLEGLAAVRSSLPVDRDAKLPEVRTNATSCGACRSGCRTCGCGCPECALLWKEAEEREAGQRKEAPRPLRYGDSFAWHSPEGTMRYLAAERIHAKGVFAAYGSVGGYGAHRDVPWAEVRHRDGALVDIQASLAPPPVPTGCQRRESGGAQCEHTSPEHAGPCACPEALADYRAASSSFGSDP